MLVVEFVLIIQNFVEHFGDYFRYSKLVEEKMNFIYRFLCSMMQWLTINAVLK
jgi:hypothetical protein